MLQVPESVLTQQDAVFLGKEVYWWAKGDRLVDLDEDSNIHIESLIRKGYREGELLICDDNGDVIARGWWNVK